MELSQRQIHSAFGSGKKESDHEHRCSEPCDQWAHRSGLELPFFFECRLCAGLSLPYKLPFSGNQSDFPGLALSSAIFPLCGLGQFPYPVCASTFLICKIELKAAPNLVAGLRMEDYPHEAFSTEAGLE